MSNSWFCLLLCLMFCLMPAATAETVRYPAIEDSGDHRSDYAIALLELALKKTGSAASLQSAGIRVSRSRSLQLLETGVEVDVVWTMTSIEREKRFLPIRIPIYKGLGSYRLLLIRADEQARFTALKDQAALRQLMFSQVHDWVDTEVLRHNKFKVLDASSYQSLFQMLLHKRVEAVPRSVLEIAAEQQQFADQSLVIESDWLLHYPGAVYFFVSNKKPQLAQQIERGLRLALKDGSFDLLFQKHFVSHLKKMKLSDRKLAELENPFLPPETPLAKSALWYQPE
ncbi:MAG: transporter substrate-binding domain-containing protein [Gammaproteobacteria bacterium]|nr:transporter substrate-binding domain-containing protein [Gammaproteobacteria bacterium]MBU2057188.1 transporter substrate-binding domain-containing protein [Gammaproteobacteria bacterium]MBU2174961.1 transporter substrate-binding domain-containing protein [Gammaproteobacteria bacterium]MBU2246276.1 transporter substrate-binding domain-containing protein [Gammaproteobacteria bacterium]MBU2346159.1 transporter substrate-binding domain-containing protein [Gammaproteobacteria bacterium]